MKRCLCSLIIVSVLIATLSTVYLQYSVLLKTHHGSDFLSTIHHFPTLYQTVYINISDSPSYLEEKQSNVTKSNIDSSLHNNNSIWPKVCLLLTFPNSGTSYTLGGVERRTNFAVGTNYKREILQRQSLDKTTINRSPFIQLDTSQRGPYWLPGPALPTPDMKSYVLTKTHCTNTCVQCDPSRYQFSFHTFDKTCRSDRKRGNNNNNKPYSKQLVSRIVRVVRDPLDNIVSRFHHENKKLSKKYSDDAKGFHRFCKEKLHSYRKVEEKYFFNKTIVSLFQGIPCYADFYRYTMWHNHAQTMIDMYNLPSLLLYYEDYDCSSAHGGNNNSMFLLLEFLNLSEYRNQSIGCEDFRTGTSYHNYYSKDEKHKVWLLIQNISSLDVWSILGRYRTPKL